MTERQSQQSVINRQLEVPVLVVLFVLLVQLLKEGTWQGDSLRSHTGCLLAAGSARHMAAVYLGLANAGATVWH
jgi:hypothetical protein